MIIYQGPSMLDGSPIVAIVTGLGKKSANSKTGTMPQVWILRSDMHPIDAMRTGNDVSICGDCPHRPQVTGDDALRKEYRSCYVNTMAPASVYRQFSRDAYDVVTPDVAGMRLAGSKVRIGAYGDPAAVPVAVWESLLRYCESTGYTHQWRTCDNRLASYCMASCDSALDVITAKMLGYRVFYVVPGQDPCKVVESYRLTTCPASREAGKKLQCQDCMACSGARSGRRADITILMH